MKKTMFLLLPAVALFVFACKNENKQTEVAHAALEKVYGMIGTDTVKQYTLANASGMKVSILNYGGTVTNLVTPDKSGQPGDVILGYDSLSGYLQSGNPYFGCLVGRYANRIAQGKFTLDGTAYTLAQNNGQNALHGGIKGFDKVIWQAELLGDTSLKLVYISKDGEEGYPGTLTSTVVYTLTAANELKMEYSATTDKPTPVNLTNHCYFNLSAGKDSTILNHELTLHANQFTEVNDQLIPTGKLPDVKGTPMDFTTAKQVGKEIASVKGGYDHNWVLDRKANGLQPAGALYDPSSGRYMEVLTTQPGIQFYTGNFLNGSLRNRDGKTIVKHGGLCLETQHYPDGPNQPSFPNTILKPGETYHHITVYKFSVK
jgi:aldose 1-epimerase